MRTLSVLVAQIQPVQRFVPTLEVVQVALDFPFGGAGDFALHIKFQNLRLGEAVKIAVGGIDDVVVAPEVQNLLMEHVDPVSLSCEQKLGSIAEIDNQVVTFDAACVVQRLGIGKDPAKSQLVARREISDRSVDPCTNQEQVLAVAARQEVRAIFAPYHCQRRSDHCRHRLPQCRFRHRRISRPLRFRP